MLSSHLEFVNQGTKLYVIMQFILKSKKSFNPAFKQTTPAAEVSSTAEMIMSIS